MTKFCHACGQQIDDRAEICPNCGVRQPGSGPGPAPVGYAQGGSEASSKKIVAGICALLLGEFGIHKFILGMTTPGLIMLLVTILTCGIGGIVMWVIGIIEGIKYLTASDAEFHQRYVVERQEWF